MYKRRARIIFCSIRRVGLASKARQLAVELGAQWLEADAATTIELLRPEQLQWADLVVTLGTDRAISLELPSHVRHSHWQMATADDDILRERIEGMIGGLRMLSRLDGPLMDKPET